jgi:hypothetical protein
MEGMIWVTIIVSTIKRHIRHVAQHVEKTEISTRKVAMCFSLVVNDIIQSLKHACLISLIEAISRAVEFLAVNARMAHPKRDRKSGRLELGLRPVFHDSLHGAPGILAEQAVLARGFPSPVSCAFAIFPPWP